MSADDNYVINTINRMSVEEEQENAHQTTCVLNIVLRT